MGAALCATSVFAQDSAPEDLLPPEVAAALTMLRADADAMPPTQLRRVLGRAWGKNWEERFREFDWEPIAAASIVAKVWRDARMQELDQRFPGYGFARNAGYGTAQHLLALSERGPSPEHRRSFAPVRRALAGP